GTDYRPRPAALRAAFWSVHGVGRSGSGPLRSRFAVAAPVGGDGPGAAARTRRPGVVVAADAGHRSGESRSGGAGPLHSRTAPVTAARGSLAAQKVCHKIRPCLAWVLANGVHQAR